MKSTLLSSHPLARLLLLANAVFWLVFAIYFVSNSRPYKPHPLMFEEQSPLYTYYGRALPVEQYMTPLMRTTRFIQWPSFFMARPFFWYFGSRGIGGERLYARVSVTGYYLLIVGALSFLQWFVVGILVDYFTGRLPADRGEVPTNPGHAYDARR